jgi:hypothetical protein
MSQDNPSNVNDLEAIAAVFGPVARIIEPLVDRYRPAIDELISGVAEVAEAFSEEAPSAAAVQARVEAAVPLLVEHIKESGVPGPDVLLGVWVSSGALVNEDADEGETATDTGASQIDGQLDDDEQADLVACTKVLGVVAGLIAPIYQNYRPMYDALSRAVATVLSEADDELPGADELTDTIRSVKNEVRPLLAKLKDGELPIQVVIGSAGLFLAAATGGDKSALKAFETGRYNRDEFDRIGKEQNDGLPGVAVAQAVILQLTEIGMAETAEEALDFYAEQAADAGYQLLNKDALEAPADGESDDE